MAETESPPCCRVAAAVVVFEDEPLGNRIVRQISHLVVGGADRLVGWSIAIGSFTPALHEERLNEHIYLQAGAKMNQSLTRPGCSLLARGRPLRGRWT